MGRLPKQCLIIVLLAEACTVAGASPSVSAHPAKPLEKVRPTVPAQLCELLIWCFLKLKCICYLSTLILLVVNILAGSSACCSI